MPWVGKAMDRKATRRRVAASLAEPEITRKARELLADLPDGIVRLLHASYLKQPLTGFSASTYRAARKRGLREDGELTELGRECGRLLAEGWTP